jgi:hypothetical protein
MSVPHGHENGILEVTIRIGGNDEITHAVVIGEDEQTFTRCDGETRERFQRRVRAAAAAAGRGICWGGLPEWE